MPPAAQGTQRTPPQFTNSKDTSTQPKTFLFSNTLLGAPSIAPTALHTFGSGFHARSSFGSRLLTPTGGALTNSLHAVCVSRSSSRIPQAHPDFLSFFPITKRGWPSLEDVPRRRPVHGTRVTLTAVLGKQHCFACCDSCTDARQTNQYINIRTYNNVAVKAPGWLMMTIMLAVT